MPTAIIQHQSNGANADLAATLGVLDNVSGPDAGGNYRAACPACGNRTNNPSLSVKVSQFGTVLYRCFRDCTSQAIEAAIKARQAGGIKNTVAAPARQAALSKDAMLAYALRILTDAGPAGGTVVETYLCSREIKLSIPPTLKFHPSLKHPNGKSYPAMIGAVMNADGHLIGVHRTFLTPDGKKAPVEPVKMSLGGVSGGAVRLVAPGAPFVPAKLAIAEGIETALSVMQMNPGLAAWAALSTSGMRNLIVPGGVREIIICADGDEAGEKAARQLRVRLEYQKRTVRVEAAPAGKDFNDLLLQRKRVKL